MSRMRWLIVGTVLSLACLLVVGFAGLWVVRNIPAAARLVYGDPPTAIPLPTLRATFTPRLPIATLTPVPEPTHTEALPTSTPISATFPPSAVTGSPPVGSPTATLTATAEPPTPTPQPPTSTPTPQPPTPTPRPQWIAFETRRGSLGDYEIFAMAPDGSRLVNLTNSWADDLAPVWSPDGEQIAFESHRDTLTGKWGLGNGSIYLLDFDPLAGSSRGNVVRLTDDAGNDTWATWSPDGQRIAFQSDRSGNWEIWSIQRDGSGLTQLTDHPAPDRYPAWSPDGRQLAFTSKRSGDEDIWLLNVQDALQGLRGSGLTNLTQSPGRDRYPFWSPDGKQLTFNTDREGNLEVYLMNADGSKPRNLSQSPESTEGLADWSPDGKRLVLYSNRPGNKDIFIVDLATGRWTNITKHPASDEFCTWSP